MVATRLRRLSCLVLLFCGAVQAATITVQADRDPVALNESFQLIFESDGSVDDDPDFAPLNRDFQVLSTGVSSNMSIVNGRVSSVKRWQLTVLARRAGKLPIPRIHFGSDVSDPITVTVERVPAPTAANEEIMLEVEATPERPYVQAQIIYRVRLLLSVGVANASLTDPQVSGTTAVVEKLGEDNQFQTRRGGKVYDVVERAYAIYPQGSGHVTIDPVVFQAQRSRGGGFFSNPFGVRPDPVVIQSDEVDLEVRPIPDTFTGGHWLPAGSVTLTEDWSPDQAQYVAGEPVTRTLRLRAEGQTASQLPELPAWTDSRVKQYPDLPDLSDERNAKGITGSRTEKIALIPGVEGEYVLPEMVLPWWNTTSDRMEYARIPERRIQVAPMAGGGANPAPVTAPAPLESTPAAPGTSPMNTAAPAPATPDPGPSAGTPAWRWLSLGLLLAWLATLLLWWRSTRRRKLSAGADTGSQSLARVVKELRQACRQNDARIARECLLRWERLAWPAQPGTSQGGTVAGRGAALAEEIRRMNQALYGRAAGGWDGEAFWRAFAAEQRATAGVGSDPTGELEPLYRL